MFCLVSCFNHDVVVHEINWDSDSLVSTMRQLAREHVYNEIGKNNYVDTLDSEYKDKPLESCPYGYVLRASPSKRIDVYFHSKINGYLSTAHKLDLRGYYTVIPAAKVVERVVETSSVETPTASPKSPSRKNSSSLTVTPEVCNLWTSMIIPAFKDELERRRRVMTALDSKKMD